MKLHIPQTRIVIIFAVMITILYPVNAECPMFTDDPIEVLHILEELSPEQRVITYRFLQKDVALEVFEQLDPDFQEQLLNSFSAVQAVQIIEVMETDDRVRLLNELSALVAERLVTKLSAEERKKTALLRKYEQETASRVMTPDYLSLKKNMTVNEAIEHMRTSNVDKDNLTTLYVTDEYRILSGIGFYESVEYEQML